MAGTILYVHGAGNRAEQASAYERTLREGLGLSAASPRLHRSHWGEEVGPASDFPGLEAILPEPIPGGAGLAPAISPDEPLAPLAALAGPGAAGFAAPKDSSDQLLGLLAAGVVDLDELGLPAESIAAAAASVGGSAEYAAASAAPATVVEATLSSVSAVALAAQGGAAFGVGDVVGALGTVAGGIARQLLGTEVGAALGTWAGSSLLPGLKLGLSRRLAEDRAAIMRKSALVPTDVLFYQRQGARIREFVRGEIAALEPPVVALGHSLGGIILVDTLFETGAPKTAVELLVTFGSQSAYLQTVGALAPLEPNLPWVNVWTRYDFVSFIAGGAWPGKVTDVEVTIETGFPDAHGAYYAAPGFIATLKAQPAIAAILG